MIDSSYQMMKAQLQNHRFVCTFFFSGKEFLLKKSHLEGCEKAQQLKALVQEEDPDSVPLINVVTHNHPYLQ